MPRANSHTARLAPCQFYSVARGYLDLSEEIRVVVVDDSVEKRLLGPPIAKSPSA
jgi:hypothetical protein